MKWNKISLQINDDLCHQIFTVLETEPNNVAQAGLEFWSFCLGLLSARITLIYLLCHQFKRQWLSSKITTFNRNVNIKKCKLWSARISGICSILYAFCICHDWRVKYTMVSLLDLMDKIYGEKYFDGTGETEKQFSGQEHLFSQRAQLLFPAPSGWPPTFCNSPYRKSDTFFTGTRHAHGAQTCIQAKHTFTQYKKMKYML